MDTTDRGIFTVEEDVYPTLTQLVKQLTGTSAERKDIPIVFIPGFAGWGEPLFKFFNYFGGFFNTMQALVDDGWHVICPHLGPISSNWERACEVYAQLTKIGKEQGFVDYGPSFENDPTNPYRTRRGRYTEGVMKNPDGTTVSGITPDWKWDQNHPVHFVCHSQGGNTIRYLVYLLENGGVPGTYFERPVEGAGRWVRSVTTLATPYNGTTVLDVVDELGQPMNDIIRQVILTAQHPRPEERFFDLKLDHWGICQANANEDYTAFILRQSSPNGPYTLWRNSEWHGFYDNSITGIATRLAVIEPSRNVFYFTLATAATIDISLAKGLEKEYEHFLRGKNEGRMIQDLQGILTGGTKQDVKRVQDEVMGMIKTHAPKVLDTAHKTAGKIGSHLPPSLKASISKHAAGISSHLPPSLAAYGPSSHAPPQGQQQQTGQAAYTYTPQQQPGQTSYSYTPQQQPGQTSYTYAPEPHANMGSLPATIAHASTGAPATSSQSFSATGHATADINPATAFTTTVSNKDVLLPRLDILPLFTLTAFKMSQYELKPHQRAEIVEVYPAREAGFENSAAWWQNDGVVNTVSMAGPRNVNVLHWGGAVTGITPGVYTYLGVNETLDHADVLGISGNMIKSERVVLTYRMIGRLLSHL